MASLRRACGGAGILTALAVCPLASCATGNQTGKAEGALFDVPVTCEAGTCKNQAGEVAIAEPLTGWSFVSTETSRFAPSGNYAFLELTRGSGAVTDLELDLPTSSGNPPAASYSEYIAGARVFHSSTANGTIELAEDFLGDACTCADGRFNLSFVDYGPDGHAGTADDQSRRVASAVFDTGNRCTTPWAPIVASNDGIDVQRVDRCALPRGAIPAPASPSPSPDWHPSTSTGGVGSSSTSSGGCGGSSASSSGGCGGDSSSGGGCGGDSASSSGGCGGDSSGGGGCGGDSASSGGGCGGDSTSSGGGCGGDSGDGGGSCAGDTPEKGCEVPTARAPGRIGARALGRSQLLVWLCAVLVYRLRRRRPR